MAQIESWFAQDLTKPVKVHYIDGNVFSQDNDGNLVGVRVFADGEPATLSGTVAANVIRADGGTVAVSGTLSGNSVSVVLPAAAYAVPGIISIIIKLTDGETITTLCAAVANVYQSSTDTIIDPGTIIPSIQTLIDTVENVETQVEEVIASIPEDYTNLSNDVDTLKSAVTENEEEIIDRASVIFSSTDGRFVILDNNIIGMPLKGCTVQIEPVQSGSGDPSAQNIRPITGWTGCKIYSTGRNQLDPTLFSTNNNQYIKYETGNVATWSSSYRASDYVPVVAGLQYTLHATFSGQSSAGLAFYDSSKQYISGIQMNSGTKTDYTFTVPVNAMYMRFCDNKDKMPFEDVFLVLGDVPGTYTVYVAPSIKTITWGTEAGTVYGGEIGDKLKKTWEHIASYNGETLPGRWISDRDVYVEGTTPTTGAQVIYELSVPVEYDVSVPTIETLDGTTYIFADCGSIAVEYRADTKKYITDKLEEKNDLLTWDQVPTSGSNNPVTSSGIKSFVDLQEERITDLSAELNDLSSAIGNSYSYVINTFVSGEGTDSGTIHAKSTRIVTESLIAESGIYRIKLNGQKVYVRVFDGNTTKVFGSGWVAQDYYDFCVSSGCSYSITLEKADGSAFSVDENATILYKEINQIRNVETNTEIINNYIEDQRKIQLRIPYEAWWNKRIDSSLTFAVSSSRISNITPIPLKTGEAITISVNNVAIQFDAYFYTDVDNVKTKKSNTGWRSIDYLFEADEDCYCVINIRYSNDSAVSPLDADLFVFKRTTGNNSEAQTELPDYWVDYLNQKIPEIRANIIDVGNHGDTFMLVTDTHWENNRGHSPEIMTYLKDKTNISFGVNCGDLIQGVATQEEAYNLLTNYCQKTKGINPFYIIRGNHDNNMDGAYRTGEITDGNFYAICDKPLENILNTNKNVYYYKDNESQKIRYIFVDMTDITTWLASVISSTPTGYSIAVFTHYLFTPKAATDTGDLEVSPFGQNLVNTIDSNKPNGVDVIGIFGGHVHRDFYTHATNGYLLVGTTCDANAASYFDPVTPSRTEGTTEEQVIDVVSINTSARTVEIVRIGAGNSRSLTY